MTMTMILRLIYMGFALALVVLVVLMVIYNGARLIELQPDAIYKSKVLEFDDRF